MKNTVRKLASLVVLAGFLNAAGATNYSPEGTITGMFSGADNTVGVFHSGAWYNPANCPNGAADRVYLIDYSSAQNWSKVHAMLISAYVAEKPIMIGVNLSTCFAGYPVIERVAFGKGY